MSTATYQSPYHQLYAERCVEIHQSASKYGSAANTTLLKPTFWNPQPLTKESLCLYGDEDLAVKPEWKCDRVISKLIACGLELELEVGNFVRDASDRELPKDPYLKKLLQSNIADEAKHFKGFCLAKEVYDVELDHLREAANIRSWWQFLAEKEHPLLVAMALEIGVFLPFLGCSRLFGGKSIATLSKKVAEDEYRHILANRTLLEEIGINAWTLPPAVERLVKETISWAIADLHIPESELDEDFNLDFVIEASQQLVATGEAEAYNDVVFVADHVLPFEVSNASQYDRVVEELNF